MSGLARTLAVTLTGLTGHIVEVEAHCAPGLPAFTLVGLPDAAVRPPVKKTRRWNLKSALIENLKKKKH